MDCNRSAFRGSRPSILRKMLNRQPSCRGFHRRSCQNLDENRDGSVSRQEYMLKRQRPAEAGSRGTSSQMRRLKRLDSRFRAADRNRDGKLSGPEIDAMKGRRF